MGQLANADLDSYRDSLMISSPKLSYVMNRNIPTPPSFLGQAEDVMSAEV